MTLKDKLDRLCKSYTRGLIGAYAFKHQLIDFLISQPDPVDFNTAFDMANTIFAKFQDNPDFDTGNPMA